MRARETRVGCTYIPDNANHIIYPATLTLIDRIQAAAAITQTGVTRKAQTPASRRLLVADNKLLKSLLKCKTPTI